MYFHKTSFVLGFHGCDESIRDALLKGEIALHYSTNEWDWLGHGMYFWESSPLRALEYAIELKNNPHRTAGKIEKPSVIGAIIDLGNCFDLLQHENLKVLKETYDILQLTYQSSGIQPPKNRISKETGELLIRKLDCLLINAVHEYKEKLNIDELYDSVRGVFFEGPELYPNAGFREKNHVQLCVRNPNCIKGYFLPRELDTRYRIP
ncbi:hypothetical protein [Emticicia agri]|uniref:PARP catalytic domain-containing protein n=1 Tax=Emticicia agri TaxID=2492393 RepID=A0A4Q5M1I2_9BACT|nr:hypothetical protein [Emticicia agri]RYU95869.1 hypothetical protein EWM59_09600 [Emticicia agri]